MSGTAPSSPSRTNFVLRGNRSLRNASTRWWPQRSGCARAAPGAPRVQDHRARVIRRRDADRQPTQHRHQAHNLEDEHAKEYGEVRRRRRPSGAEQQPADTLTGRQSLTSFSNKIERFYEPEDARFFLGIVRNQCSGVAPADLWCRYGERLTGPDVVALESDAREFAALRATCTGNGNRELSWFAVREGRVLSMAWAESVPGTLDDEVAQEIMDLLSSKLIDP